MTSNLAAVPSIEGARRVRLTPASSIRPRPVRWTWDERLPLGEITLTPGRGGVGKSTFHAWVIAQLTRGHLPGVHFGTPRACIISASEDSWERTIVPRLIVAGADLDLVFRVDVSVVDNHGLSLTLPADIGTLAGEIRRVGAVLLSLDPLMSAIGDGVDTHKDRDVRGPLEPLAKLADSTGCTVLGNAHFNKSSGSDPLSLIMGSAAFGNVARAALAFAVDTDAEDGSCVISQIKNNLGRSDLPSLRYVIENVELPTDEGVARVGKLVMCGESGRSVSDILRDRDRGDGEESGQRDEAGAWLVEYLTENGGHAEAKDVKKIGKAVGFAERTLDRAKSAKGITSKREGFGQGGRYVWRLPCSPHEPHARQLPERGEHAVHGGEHDAEPVSSATDSVTCAVCLGPMAVTDPWQTTHPGCDLDMNAGLAL